MISVKKQLVTHFQNKNSRVKSNTQFNAVVQITFFLKSLKLQSVLYGTHQTARGNDVLDKGREWLRLIALAGGDIGDNAGVKIHLDLVAVLDVLGCLVTFEDSKTAIPQSPFCKEKLKDAEAKCDVPAVGASVEGPANFIDFENYDVGGAGKAYYDMDTENQGKEYREDRVDIVKNGDGFAVGYTQKGEWLEYTVNVETSGTLPFELSYATGMESASVRFFMDNEPITDTLSLSGTEDFDTYATYKGKTTKELTKGEHVLKVLITSDYVLKVLITSDYVNLDWIAFGKIDGDIMDKRNGTTGILPKIAAGAFAKIAGEYKVFDLMGNMLGKVRLNAGASLTDIKTSLKIAGYHNGAYIVRNSVGQTFRVNFGK